MASDLTCPFCQAQIYQFFYNPKTVLGHEHDLGIYVDGVFHKFELYPPHEYAGVCLNCHFVGWGGSRAFDTFIDLFPNGEAMPDSFDLRRLKSTTVALLSIYSENAALELRHRGQNISDLYEARKIISMLESPVGGLAKTDFLQRILTDSFKSLFHT
jgi:hypothetical protein